MVPGVRALSLLLALGLLAAPLDAARRVRHARADLRRGTEAVHWLRTTHLQRLTTGETHHRLEVMSRDASAYFAGFPDLMLHDLEHVWAWAAEPPGPRVLLAGDTTVHNLVTLRDGRGHLTYDWLRFDHATYGGALTDLRRLLVSLALTAQEMGLDDSDINGISLETARTYRDALRRFAGAATTREWAMTAEHANPFVRRSLTQASHERREDLLLRWTIETSRGRRFRTEGEFAPIRPEQAHAFHNALLAMRTDPRPAAYYLVKDAVVRSDDGTHRGLHHRVYLLIEGSTPSLYDDFILEASLPWQGARRVQWAAWQFRRAPEPFFAVLDVDGKEYLLREVQPTTVLFVDQQVRQGLDDIHDLGRATATLLARAHALTASSTDELRAFADGWVAAPAHLEAGLMRFGLGYTDQVRVDLAALQSHLTGFGVLRPHGRRVRRSWRARGKKPAAAASPSAPAPAPASPAPGHK